MIILENCPFCGSNDVHTAWYHYDDLGGSKAVVECRNCYCSSGYYKKLDEAVKAWNKRSKAPELKPCPFCGGTARMKYLKQDGEFTPKEEILGYVECSKCHAVSVSGSDIENIIDYWNSRSDI